MLEIIGDTIRLTRADYANITVECIDKDTGEPHIFTEGESVVFRIGSPIKFEKPCPINIGESTCTLIFEEADTKLWKFGTYKYELEYRDVNDKPDTFIANASFILTIEQEDHDG